MKTLKILGIGFLIGFVSSALAVKKFWPTTLEVVGETKYETKWEDKYVYLKQKPKLSQEAFDDCLECQNSSFEFEKKVEGDTIYVTAKDKCKSARIGYKIRSNTYNKRFIQAGIGYTLDNQIVYSAGYLVSITRNLAAGGELLFVSKEPRLLFKLQIGF